MGEDVTDGRKFRLIPIEPQEGCDPVCPAKPVWNTTAPPIGDSPLIAPIRPAHLPPDRCFFRGRRRQAACFMIRAKAG
jgi:hypothetical protein